MKKKNLDYLFILILIVGIFLGVYRYVPYIVGNTPLGYDPGLYRSLFLEYFNNLPNIDFSNLTPWTKGAYPPFLGLLGNIFMIIGFDVDFLLTFGLASFSLITSIYLYLYLKKYSFHTAIFGIVIFCISIIQYESFLLNYYKQIIGIIFMLVSMYLLEKKKYILSTPIIISLFTIHRPSGLYFLLLFILYKLFHIKKSNTSDLYIVLFSGIVAFFMYLPFLNELIIPLISPLFGTFMETGNSGTFFSREYFWLNNYVIIIASLYGLYIKIQKKDFDYITLGYLLGMIWIGLGLFFYNRFYIFYDLFIILIAAYGFGELYKKNKNFLIVFMIFFYIQSFNYIIYTQKNDQAFISQQEFSKIQDLDNILPKNAILMTTNRVYSPWLFGYTNLPVIAPGLFEYDLWTLKEWSKWWNSNGKTKCEMMKEYKIYNKEIYLWLGQEQYPENLDGADCFKQIYKNGRNMILRYRE